MLSIEIIYILTIGIVLFSIYYFFKRNDELPGLITLVFLNTGILRYIAVVKGNSEWVNVNYNRIAFNLNNEKAVLALNYFLLGTILFISFYIFFRSFKNRKNKFSDSNDSLKKYILKYRYIFMWAFLLFMPINTLAISMISGSMAMGNSYFYLFGLAVGGLIILLSLVWKFTPSKSFFQKGVFFAMFVYGAYLSFSPNLRFQFLSWTLALGIFLTGNFKPTKKISYYLIGGVLILFLFSLAGVARSYNISNLSWEERISLSFERNDSREDQNMLDGFMMVLDIYPQYSDFQYGKEHLSILARPIPRQLWPDKPVGGYTNRLGLNDVNEGTVGISQTLYGSFYEEGGVTAIVILCFIYGYLFARIINYSERFQSDIRWLIKGLLIASTLPLLRGGDLPGIYAFIGMGFWPVFLFIYQFKKGIR